jgi:hypothetical protein
MARRRSASAARPVWQPAWRRGLPTSYARQVTSPVRYECFDDEQTGASRVIGYDRWGQRCYARHAFIFSELQTDDDESFYEARTYGQYVAAWRVADGRWLTRTLERGAACACQPERISYTMATAMPR